MLFWLLAILVPCAQAAKLSLAVGVTDCFAETLVEDHTQLSEDKLLRVDAAVEVLASSGKANYNKHRNVEATIVAPDGQVLKRRSGVWQSEKLSIVSYKSGTYKLCITNTSSGQGLSLLASVIFFTITHDDRVQQDVIQVPKGTESARQTELASHMHLTQAHDVVIRIAEQLNLVAKEQRYMYGRVDRHMQTNLTLHVRTFGYACVEVAAVFLCALVQVTTIRHLLRKHAAGKGIIGVR